MTSRLPPTKKPKGLPARWQGGVIGDVLALRAPNSIKLMSSVDPSVGATIRLAKIDIESVAK